MEGQNSAIMTVKIGPLRLENDNRALPRVSECLDGILNWNMLSKGMSDWRGQWASAVFMEGPEEASILDWAFHVISMPWMLLFAVIPPTIFAGGWVCFFCCLGFIA